MSHCTLVAHKFVSAIFGRSRITHAIALAAVAWKCTCCGGVDNALAAVAWAMHLLRWGGYGVDNALAAVRWIWRGKHLLWCREQLENRGQKFS